MCVRAIFLLLMPMQKCFSNYAQIPVLEISMGDFGAYNDKLVVASQNGKCEKWKREVYAPTPTMFSESKARAQSDFASFSV